MPKGGHHHTPMERKSPPRCQNLYILTFDMTVLTLSRLRKMAKYLETVYVSAGNRRVPRRAPTNPARTLLVRFQGNYDSS